MTIGFVINHLWQSSCFVLLAALLAFALRANSPKIRYWIWLSASLKFLVPFAFLVGLGSAVPRPVRQPVSAPAPLFLNTLVTFVEPSTPARAANVTAHPLRWAPVSLGVLWAVGFLAITLARCRSWLRLRAALRAGTPVDLPIAVRALSTPGVHEPGIIGFLRPVLILPDRLLEHLSPQQLDTVLTHELCHVRRRDNLFAAAHMVVESIFWFNPLVWWVGSRLLEERELACDEEVLRTGCEPTDYVEGILKVCRLYTESTLRCVSGVTGADVKRRLRAILTGYIAQELTNTRRAALAIIGRAAVLVPIAIGVLTAPVSQAQSVRSNTPAFEVASLKVNRSAPDFSSKGRLSNGRLVFTNFSLRYLIAEAWSLRATDIVGPSWLEDVSIDLAAIVPSPAASAAEVRQMIQTLLKERMRLVAHLEDRVVPVFALTVWKGNPKLNRSELPARPEDADCSMHNETSKVLLDCHHMSMAEFAHELPGPGSRYLDKRIVDQTKLSGFWDFKLEWTKMTELESYGGLTLFAALESQLGLHLEEKKAAAPVLVIDSMEKTPSDN